jgi:hypothetical protein
VTLQNDFAELTGRYLNATADTLGIPVRGVNVIGCPCEGGVYHSGCPGMWEPNMSSLVPLLSRPEIDGVFWYVTIINAHHTPTHAHKISKLTADTTHSAKTAVVGTLLFVNVM